MAETQVTLSRYKVRSPALFPAAFLFSRRDPILAALFPGKQTIVYYWASVYSCARCLVPSCGALFQLCSEWVATNPRRTPMLALQLAMSHYAA